ncbi:MAG TPA: glycosyltransferase family 4 protein, partial [Caulobacteraceae bacterium]|nr:glycosyltransferase family 4 protein [Caulobacteraceae bacterium]
ERHSLGPLANLRYAAGVRRLVAEVRPDVFLAYTAKPVVWGVPAARAAGAPVVAALITGLGYAFTEGREPKRRLAKTALAALYRRALARCDRIIFQNPDDLSTFRALGIVAADAPVAVVNGSGIDLTRFAPAPPPAEVSFLMIARLLKDKGVREYAAAALALKQRYPHVAWRLAGFLDPSPDAITQDELDRWIAGGLEYLGRLEDVRPALAACACYVLPSYREGTPRTVLEAMAMQRPVITTDAPGCRETVIDGENGFLVPPRDTKALERAMERMIADPGKLADMGLRSRRMAEGKYDVREVNSEMMRLLQLPGKGR